MSVFYLKEELNNYGSTVLTGLNTTSSHRESDIPSPDLSGVGEVYEDRFTTRVGPAQTLDIVSYNNYSSLSGAATTGTYNGLNVLTMEGEVDSNAVFNSSTPNYYENRPLDIRISWTAEETGTVVFGASVENYETGTVGAGNFGPEVTGEFVNESAAASNQAVIKLSSVATTDLRKSQNYGIKVARKGTDAQDSLAEDAYITSIEIRESKV